MAFNGSGTYNLPAGNPVVTGTTISSSTTNTTNSDIATALTNCITRDGQSTPSANLPMNAKKLTGLAVGTSAGDSVRYEQTARINESTGANSNITSLTGLTTALSAAQGGTGLAGGGSTAGLVLTADGAGGFTLSSSSPSVVRSAKTSAYTVVAGDKGTLIEVTSGTFTLSLTAAATLGSGWWCYVSNIGTGLITIDPNSSETITVNGTAMSTWVQWTTEVGILQCDGTGFNYYQMQKGYTQQTVSSNVSALIFSSGLNGRKALRLATVNGDFTTGANIQIRVNNNTVSSPTWVKAMGNDASGTASVSAVSTNFLISIDNSNCSLAIAYDFTVSSSGLIVSGGYSAKGSSTERKYYTQLAYYALTDISDIRLYNASAVISAGTFTLTEL